MRLIALGILASAASTVLFAVPAYTELRRTDTLRATAAAPAPGELTPVVADSATARAPAAARPATRAPAGRPAR